MVVIDRLVSRPSVRRRLRQGTRTTALIKGSQENFSHSVAVFVSAAFDLEGAPRAALTERCFELRPSESVALIEPVENLYRPQFPLALDFHLRL
jgi:hypothetical protein